MDFWGSKKCHFLKFIFVDWGGDRGVAGPTNAERNMVSWVRSRNAKSKLWECNTWRQKTSRWRPAR
jgi:hypothetical protein